MFQIHQHELLERYRSDQCWWSECSLASLVISSLSGFICFWPMELNGYSFLNNLLNFSILNTSSLLSSVFIPFSFLRSPIVKSFRLVIKVLLSW